MFLAMGAGIHQTVSQETVASLRERCAVSACTWVRSIVADFSMVTMGICSWAGSRLAWRLVPKLDVCMMRILYREDSCWIGHFGSDTTLTRHLFSFLFMHDGDGQHVARFLAASLRLGRLVCGRWQRGYESCMYEMASQGEAKK